MNDRIFLLKVFTHLVRIEADIPQHLLESVAQNIDQMLEDTACRKALGETGRKGRPRNKETEERDLLVAWKVYYLTKGPKEMRLRSSKKHPVSATDVVAKEFNLSAERVLSIYKKYKRLIESLDITDNIEVQNLQDIFNFTPPFCPLNRFPPKTTKG